MVYAMTILINAQDKSEVEDYIHKTFGSVWFDIEDFPYGVGEDDLAVDLEDTDE